MREWSSLDQYRLDKYYSFMRLMVRESLTFAKARAWSADALASVLSSIGTEVLESSGPNGPKLHLCDIILSELEEVAGADIQSADFIAVLQPFFAVLKGAKDKLVFTRCVERVLSGFASGRSKEEPAFPLVDAEVIQDLVFEMASAPDTRERYVGNEFSQLSGAGSHRLFWHALCDQVSGGPVRGPQALPAPDGEEGRQAEARGGHPQGASSASHYRGFTNVPPAVRKILKEMGEVRGRGLRLVRGDCPGAGGE
jgi:hypothetical protein